MLLWHLTLADVLERVRRYGYLLTLVASLYLAYNVVMKNIVMAADNYRGVYNSAWIGAMTAFSATLFISLAGFYVVNNAIERDRRTGVGQILAATSIGKWEYLMGKCLSNFVVLISIVVIQAAAAAVMQYTGGEDPRVDFWKLLSPFLLIAAPALFFTAAMAALFECVKPLSGGFGNIVWFFLWPFLCWCSLESGMPALDVFSLGLVQTDIMSAVKARFPAYEGGFSLTAGGSRNPAGMQTFVWDGFHWSAGAIALRLLPFAYSLLVIVLSALFFDRFEGAARSPKLRSVPGFRNMSSLGEKINRLMAMSWITPRSQFGRMLMAELRLMLKGVPAWWYLPMLAFWIVSLSVPIKDNREWCVPLLSLLPILLWSKMGTREERYGTGPLIFSLPGALHRQLPALWLSGVVVAAGVFSGAAFRFLLAGEFGQCAALCITIMFIPSLALALGIWSRDSKLFEAAYLVLWYIGPLHHVAALDYTFTSPSSIAGGMPLWCYFMTFLLLAGAFMGRKRQIVV